MHTVVEMENFSRSAKAANVSENEIAEIIAYLSMNPSAGPIIPGTGGARKFRFKIRGTGKRGEYPSITFYTGIAMPVFLIDIFVKGDKIDLTVRERNELKIVLSKLAATYRRRRR